MRPVFEVVPAHLDALAAQGLGTLDGCLAFGGETVKSKVAGRVVRRADGYFVKTVRGRGWKDVLVEHRALQKLAAAGLPVPQAVAFGHDGDEAALVCTALPVVASLETVLMDSGGMDAARLRRLGERVSGVAARLHATGVNHRDFYANHILLDREDNVYLVDLGRAEFRRRVPRRRIVKDLAALDFSIPERIAGRRARLRFLLLYWGADKNRRKIRRLAASVARRSARMRRYTERKVQRGVANFHLNT